MTLEICPTSNLLTKALRDEDAVRETFQRFVEHDVAFTIATDGPEMMRTHLRDEFALLHRIGALTRTSSARRTSGATRPRSSAAARGRSPCAPSSGQTAGGRSPVEASGDASPSSPPSSSSRWSRSRSSPASSSAFSTVS